MTSSTMHDPSVRRAFRHAWDARGTDHLAEACATLYAAAEHATDVELERRLADGFDLRDYCVNADAIHYDRDKIADLSIDELAGLMRGVGVETTDPPSTMTASSSSRETIRVAS